VLGVRSGEIEALAPLKQTVGKVEREIKHLADAGEPASASTRRAN
jgi:hypothetical protein